MINRHSAVGRRLAYVRGQLGLSQKEVGDILKLSWRTYQTWEVGSRPLSYENLMKFCRSFGVRPEWIMEGEEPIRSYDFNEVVGEVVGALALELRRQDRSLSPENWGKIASKMTSSRIKHGELNKEELANYVELAGEEIGS